jgi:propionyl-CoA synthetase
VIDHWWQTETGYAIAANPGDRAPAGQDRLPSVPMPGYDVQVLDEGGHPVSPGTLGAIAVKLPLPPGTLPTLWNAEDRFRKATSTTSPAITRPATRAIIDADGYLYIMARTDDVINVAGHRLSTGAMEEVLAATRTSPNAR